jgi:hypothetical protein
MTQTPEPWRAEAPFGTHGESIGDSGFDLLYYMCTERPNGDVPRWQSEDTMPFATWLALESELQDMWLPFELEVADLLRPLHRQVAKLHNGFPFSEAERSWMLRLTTEPVSRDAVQPPYEGFADLEEGIVSAGLLRVVSGRDLMRRWISWRRETDEYTGQGTLAYAQDALAHLIELVAPDESLPASYLALRQPPRT